MNRFRDSKCKELVFYSQKYQQLFLVEPVREFQKRRTIMIRNLAGIKGFDCTIGRKLVNQILKRNKCILLGEL